MPTIPQRLRQIADELEGGTGQPPPTSHPPPKPDDGGDLPLSPDNVFTEDYWVLGRVGAQAGTMLKHYSEGQQMLWSMGAYSAGVPPHMSVFKRADPSAPWSLALSNAGDLGWIDASHYYPANAVNQNFDAWVAAGCPSKDKDGKPLNGRGDWAAGGGGFSPGT